MKPKLHSFFCFATVAALLLIACAERPRPRVGVKNVAAELVFGIPPVEEPVAPAGVFPDTLEEIEESDFSDRKVLPPIDSRPTAPRCPEAGPNDFPEQASPPIVEGKPKEGTYSWKVESTRRVAAFPVPIKSSSFAQRRVQELQEDVGTPQNFRFKTYARDPGSPSITEILSFRVDALSPSPNLRGILLEKIEYDNESDDTPPVILDPQPDLMFLPTPIQQGPQNPFDTVGVDTRNFGTVQHKGYVKERKRIDACGNVIDSWFIDGEQVYTFGTARRRNYDYSIATQFGGMIVFEHSQNPCARSEADGSCTPAPEFEYDTNLGQVEPGPLGKPNQ